MSGADRTRLCRQRKKLGRLVLNGVVVENDANLLHVLQATQGPFDEDDRKAVAAAVGRLLDSLAVVDVWER